LRKNEVGQQRERMRRIGVLIVLAADDPEAQARLATLLEGLQPLGWTVGSNLRIDTRWAAGSADKHSQAAAELAAYAPDIILAGGSPALEQLLRPLHLNIRRQRWPRISAVAKYDRDCGAIAYSKPAEIRQQEPKTAARRTAAGQFRRKCALLPGSLKQACPIEAEQ
jgi:hypothetical protein